MIRMCITQKIGILVPLNKHEAFTIRVSIIMSPCGHAPNTLSFTVYGRREAVRSNVCIRHRACARKRMS